MGFPSVDKMDYGHNLGMAGKVMLGMEVHVSAQFQACKRLLYVRVCTLVRVDMVL